MHPLSTQGPDRNRVARSALIDNRVKSRWVDRCEKCQSEAVKVLVWQSAENGAAALICELAMNDSFEAKDG